MSQNTTGNRNIAIGDNALYSNVTGDLNTVLGRLAGTNILGSNNTLIGYRAGYSETGSNKLYISTGIAVYDGDEWVDTDDRNLVQVISQQETYL